MKYTYVARGGVLCPPFVSRRFNDDQGRLHSEFVGEFMDIESARKFADNMIFGIGHWPDCIVNHGGTECDMGPQCGTDCKPET